MSDLSTRLIFNKLDSIENKTQKMAHEIPAISGYLRQWQDGHLKSSAFSEILNKYIDQLNK